MTRAERADAFIDAAVLGHIGGARLIASGEVDVNACDDDESNTALILASQNGRPMVVAALLEAGADVDAANDNGDTPLILARLVGHGHIVDALLKAGANVSAVDQFGSCALFYASRQGHCGLVDALLAAGADVNHSRVPPRCSSPRFVTRTRVGMFPEAARRRRRRRRRGRRRATPRCTGARSRRLQVRCTAAESARWCALLIKACVDTTATNNDGFTPLQLARSVEPRGRASGRRCAAGKVKRRWNSRRA